MFKSTLGAAVLLASLALAQNANATLIFADNFNTEKLGLNYNGFAKWDVTEGSVDLIGAVNFFQFFSKAQGRYVDLDGTPLGVKPTPASVLSTKTIFKAGTYTLSFLLAGNQREKTQKSTEVTLGDFSVVIGPLPEFTPLTLETFTFTTTGGKLTFTELGKSDLKGNILDDVVLTTAVPELSTWAMMLLGFGLVGLQVRRRSGGTRFNATA